MSKIQALNVLLIKVKNKNHDFEDYIKHKYVIICLTTSIH